MNTVTRVCGRGPTCVLNPTPHQRILFRYIPFRIVTGVIAEAFLADSTEKSTHRFLFLEQSTVWARAAAARSATPRPLTFARILSVLCPSGKTLMMEESSCFAARGSGRALLLSEGTIVSLRWLSRFPLERRRQGVVAGSLGHVANAAAPDEIRTRKSP